MGIKEFFSETSRILHDKERLNRILHEGTDPLSKKVDIFILIAIIIFVLISSSESVVKVEDYSLSSFLHMELTTKGIIKTIIIFLEYFLTALFTFEYFLRVYCKPVKKDYVFSFFGIIDALAIFPQLLSIFFPAMRYFSVLRTFRLTRIFRILEMTTFINEGHILLESIRRSLTKILVYFLFVLVLVCIIGTLMFIVENGQPDTQFTSIPASIYWAIVTLTTVGYGDVTPSTALGQLFSSVVMILGYTIIAIPTGIVSAHIIDEHKKKSGYSVCPRCNRKADANANYCKFCGERLI